MCQCGGYAAAETGVYNCDLCLSRIKDLIGDADGRESVAVVEGKVGDIIVLDWWRALRRHCEDFGCFYSAWRLWKQLREFNAL